MRMQMRRFTRLTNAFSKKLENHEAAIALHYMYYNFARVQQTLRVTPAMEADISDHVWSLEEIVNLLARFLAFAPHPHCSQTAMRVLFIIVSLLGLLVTGLGVHEFYAADENDSLVSALRHELMPSYRVVDGRHVFQMYTMPQPPDNDVELERSSMAVAFTGTILCVIGVIGFIKSCKKNTTQPHI